jgi:hypothetical protein
VVGSSVAIFCAEKNSQLGKIGKKVEIAAKATVFTAVASNSYLILL